MQASISHRDASLRVDKCLATYQALLYCEDMPEEENQTQPEANTGGNEAAETVDLTDLRTRLSSVEEHVNRLIAPSSEPPEPEGSPAHPSPGEPNGSESAPEPPTEPEPTEEPIEDVVPDPGITDEQEKKEPERVRYRRHLRWRSKEAEKA